MLIDLHLHVLPHSTDSFLSLEGAVLKAKERGLDAICVTDHDSMGLRERAAAFTRETGFPVLVGVEYFSRQGDITAFGVDSFPDHRVPAQAFIDLVNAQGGFCAACHPFRNNGRGLGTHLGQVKGLHAAEVLNGSTIMEANRQALRWCRELGLKTIGASDAHVEKQVGIYATWLPHRVHNMADLVAQLHGERPRPAIWNGESYDVTEDF